MARNTKIEIHEVVIEASNYGDLKGVSIYLTDDLFKEIATKKDKSNVPVLTDKASCGLF